MGRFILGRLAFLVPTVLLVVIGSTWLMWQAPGGPLEAEKQVDPAIKKQLEKCLTVRLFRSTGLPDRD